MASIPSRDTPTPDGRVGLNKVRQITENSLPLAIAERTVVIVREVAKFHASEFWFILSV